MDLVMKILGTFQSVNGYGYAFSHKQIPPHRKKEGLVIPARHGTATVSGGFIRD
jgi:hypothetical protein